MNDYSKTYCNPTPLPDYPMGKWAYRESVAEPFRESADPTVIYHDGKWYLYPSCGERMSVYVSSDFVTWEHHFLNLPDIGYAPTAVLHKGKFYFAAPGSDLYVSDSPLGPFESAGRFTHADGTECCPSDVTIKYFPRWVSGGIGWDFRPRRGWNGMNLPLSRFSAPGVRYRMQRNRAIVFLCLPAKHLFGELTGGLINTAGVGNSSINMAAIRNN